MSKKQKIYLLIFLIVCIQSFNNDAQLFGKAFYTVNGKTYNVDSVNAQIEYVMSEVGVPGMSMAVINNGKIVFYHTYGYRNLNAKNVKKVNKKTKFEAASMSKSFVVFAAYELVDRGLLNLDTPLYRYLDYDLLKHDKRYKLITARMILGHSSGIENHFDQNNGNQLDIVSDPGKSFVYSGEGYAYLAKVIEKIAGVPLEDLMEENVYHPLKLKQTYTTSTPKANKNHASPHDEFGRYTKRFENSKPIVMSHIHSNARDYARLLTGIFYKKRISDLSVSQILTPEIKVDDQLYYGAGFELYTHGSDTLVFQGGDNKGFKGLGVYSPTSKSGFVFFANSDRADKMGKIVCKIATGMDVSPCYPGIYHNPYPSKANNVFKAFRKGGKADARKLIDKYMNAEASKGLTDNDIVELVYYFKDDDYEFANYIATEYLKKCPECSAKVVFERWLRKG